MHKEKKEVVEKRLKVSVIEGVLLLRHFIMILQVGLNMYVHVVIKI